eukprot:364174-Chlamydomonas_euryale.AAC.8
MAARWRAGFGGGDVQAHVDALWGVVLSSSGYGDGSGGAEVAAAVRRLFDARRVHTGRTATRHPGRWNCKQKLCMQAHTLMHTCVQADEHVCVGTCACMYSCMHACMHARKHACKQTNMRACMHACMHLRRHWRSTIVGAHACKSKQCETCERMQAGR